MADGLNIHKLPDNILLEILSYLPVRDRCISGRVCRRWRKIAQDYSLWKHVDLLPYMLDLRKMWTFIRAHLSTKLRTLRIRGVADRKTHEIKPPLSETMLGELRTRCTALSCLHMQPGSVIGLSATLLPGSLTHLTLRRCMWQPHWLKDSASHFSNLQYLDLSETVRVDNHDLVDIAQFSKLTVLKLDGCYRVEEQGLEAVVTALAELDTLNIRDCQTTDLVVHHIGRNLKSLQDLDISGSCLLTDSCVPTLVMLDTLGRLSLTCSSQLKPQSLLDLQNISSLRILRLFQQTKDDNIVDFATCVAALKDKMPKCNIIAEGGTQVSDA